jgi:signal transduction histidine kinase
MIILSTSMLPRVPGLLAKVGAALAVPVLGRRSHLREANGQLVEAAINAQELQAAAERAHRRQTEFIAVLAHELRNPLTPIRTAAALLVRIPPKELPSVQAVIERQVAHLSRLIGDLLDMSRIVTGKLRLDRDWLDLADAIGQAVDACRPSIDTRGQHLQIDLPSHALRMQGDALRMAQVVTNLLDNASKYTPLGGRIALSVVVVGADIVMTVSDNGIGIAPEVLPRVFETFIQDAHATRFNGAGLGIGLALVRELVEGHGGNVVARSAGTGLGSRFVVTLPLAEDAQPVASACNGR